MRPECIVGKGAQAKLIYVRLQKEEIYKPNLAIFEQIKVGEKKGLQM